ncbi:MAG: S1 RNA-binding domain-containing protein [Actinomycetes bacterium]
MTTVTDSDQTPEPTEPTIDAPEATQAPEAAEVTADEGVVELPEQLRTNDVVTGNVAKLVDFGAFVDIETQQGTVTGLVHVSEVAPGFVENIYAELGEGDEVTVKVLTIGDDGKIGLSIKQADPEWEDIAELDRPMRSKIDKDFDRRLRKFMHGSQSIQGEVRRQKRNKLGR